MTNKEIHIDLLKAYIRGELNASDSLFVEQELAQNEYWQDVYEGLVFAEEEQIDSQAVMADLEKQLFEAKQKGKPIALRKYGAIAAAIIGFLVIVYSSVELLNSSQTSTTAESNTNNALEEFDDVNLYEDVIIADANSDKNEEYEGYAPQLQPKSAEKSSILQKFTSEELVVLPINYETFIGKLGYYEIQRLNISEVPRGANSELPQNHFSTAIKDNASPKKGLLNYQDYVARNRIARYPFNGKVIVEFFVHKNGEVRNFFVKHQDDEKAAKALIELLEKEIWQPANDENNMPAKQHWQAEAHFGNTVYLRMKPL